MTVKKYEAPTLQKAIEAVKNDLGSNAIIFTTKTKRRNGLWGLWGKELVEVTASKEFRVRDIPKKRPPSTFINSYEKQAPVKEKIASTLLDTVRPAPEKKETFVSLHKELDEVKSLIHTLVKRSTHSDLSELNDELLDVYLMLIEQEVSEDIAKELIGVLSEKLTPEELENKEMIQASLMEAVMARMQFVEPIQLEKGRPKRIAFVGPTGVGKTTTIAKLAAEFSLRHKKKVALLTLDTYRIAAVEQLKTYAEIMGVPLEVVMTPREVQQAIDKHHDADLIFIDTAGRSHKNEMQMMELKGFLEAIKPDETHLVLSTTSNYKNVREALDSFDSFNVDKLIFTKIDEAVSFGLILNVMSKVNKRLSYVTTGQNVPDDIAVTDPTMLANLILKGE